MKSTQHYLRNYSEQEIHLLNNIPGIYHQVVMLPIFNESEEVLELVKNITTLSNTPILVILVVNAMETSQQAAIDANQALIHQLLSQYHSIWKNQHLRILKIQESSLLLVDRTTNLLPDKTGVGLARKIAADIALQLFSLEQVTSHWLYSIDADVELPQDYFQRINQADTNTPAAIFPFQHVGDYTDKQKLAMQLYDLSLHYYVNSLREAGSPYAHHTIGSTLAINLIAYAKVRGFPKREAGEDFYLLNKLAKLGRVKQLDGEPIRIQGRLSSRVPFGTGKGIQKIMRSDLQFSFYHPMVFAKLKDYLDLMNKLLVTDSVNQQIHKRNDLISKFCTNKDFIDQAERIRRNCSSQQQFTKALHEWFDAFRTLKFIHFIRDEAYANVSCIDLLGQDNFPQKQSK